VLTGDGSLACSGTIYDDLYQGRITGSWPVATDRKSIVYVHGCENTIMYVYGGGRAANTLNNSVTIEGGRFYQVYAGGNGSSTEVPGNPGANVSKLTGTIAPPDCGDAIVTIHGGLAGQLFGGSNSKGVVEGTSTVDIDPDGACPILTKEVFGGGNEAPGGNAIVTIPCGATGLTDVYGGAKAADIGSPTDRKNIILNIEGGDMQRVFGGNMSGGTIWGNVTVNVYGANPGHVIDEIFGGSNLGGAIKGTITVTIDSNRSDCPLRFNSVYGGSNLVNYEPTDATALSPEVNLICGTARKDVFGGGKGYQNLTPVFPYRRPMTQSEWEAVVPALPAWDSEHQTRYEDSLALYNSYADYVTQTNTAKVVANPVVNIGTTAETRASGEPPVMANPTVKVLGNIYGGGNAAPIYGNTKVDVRGNRTNIYGNVYGGGNAAKVTGNTEVKIGDY
jgi:hypothetical protein